MCIHPKIRWLLGSLFGGGGSNDSIDLDASCIMFDASKQPIDAIWFGQLQSKDGSIVHTGDNRTGAGDGDDEVINVDLSRIPAHVQSLVFTVNSFTGQTFEKLRVRFVVSLMRAIIAKWLAITYQPKAVIPR